MAFGTTDIDCLTVRLLIFFVTGKVLHRSASSREEEWERWEEREEWPSRRSGGCLYANGVVPHSPGLPYSATLGDAAHGDTIPTPKGLRRRNRCSFRAGCGDP